VVNHGGREAIEFFEVVGVTDPTVALVCRGQNALLRYGISSPFPFSGRIRYGLTFRSFKAKARAGSRSGIY